MDAHPCPAYHSTKTSPQCSCKPSTDHSTVYTAFSEWYSGAAADSVCVAAVVELISAAVTEQRHHTECLSCNTICVCRSQPGFDSAFVMNVDDEGGQQQYMGYVQFESPQAAAAAQKVRLWAHKLWLPHSLTTKANITTLPASVAG